MIYLKTVGKKHIVTHGGNQFEFDGFRDALGFIHRQHGMKGAGV